ncbi:MAG: SPFH domain-containing protein [Acidimicrobiales bacterium]
MIAVVVVIVVVGVALLLGLFGLSVKVVREYQRIVLFRLGRSVGAKGPGLVLLNPVTDRVSWVDLREQFLEIPHQTAITRDNAPIAIDFIIFYKVFDPVMSVLQVQNFSGAALNIAATTLRSVGGDMTLDDVLSKREDMNGVLRAKLDDVTERWGVKVTNVEVREINPPPAVQEAMTRQMSAERTRRAVVTESEGQKQAAVTVAEGQQQSAILCAEGDRQAAILRAEGFSLALSRIGSVAGGLDPNTLLLQYMDALRQVASAPSTKLVLPMELTNLLAGVRELAGRHVGTTEAAEGRGNGASHGAAAGVGIPAGGGPGVGDPGEDLPTNGAVTPHI